MKKFVLFFTIFTTCLTLTAQDTETPPPAKKEVQYSFAWGLFKSKDYPKEETAVFGSKKRERSTELSAAPNTANYEVKSVLWGAIQWTEKKKIASPENCPTDDQ